MSNSQKDIILASKVRVLYPDLVESLELTAKLDDVSLLPEIFSYIEGRELPQKAYLKKSILIVGVTLNLYDPDVLNGWKRNLKKGVRSILSKYFDVTDTAVSNNILTAKNYYLTYRKYKDTVDQISDEIVEIYESKD